VLKGAATAAEQARSSKTRDIHFLQNESYKWKRARLLVKRKVQHLAKLHAELRKDLRHVDENVA
jgi:hypothetical protein